jgi:lipid-A-disaccharide synthase
MAVASPRIFVSAGEPSGDRCAAEVVSALRRRWPSAVIEAFGGPALRAAGAEVRYPMEGYTVLGFLEAVGKIPAHLRLLRRIAESFRDGRYDLALLVDYPGFNVRLGQAAREAGVKVLYYIAPQLWAWRPGRVAHLRNAIDRLAVVLPFEPDFFASLGLRARFVGHPLVERSWPSRDAARRALDLGPDDRVLALFPGSRPEEVRRIWPVFRDAATRLLARGICDQVIVAAIPEGAYPGPLPGPLHRDDSSTVLASADAALVKSGTTTLEAACAGVPMVVAYRVHPVTALLARQLLTVRHVSLVNLVAGREIVPELLQGDATADRLAEAVAPLLESGGRAAMAQRAGLAEVRSRLGSPGAAERVAELVREVLAA